EIIRAPVLKENHLALEDTVLEEDHTILEALSVEQATKEPSVLPPTSSPSRSNVEEEFELSKFMFKDEGSHGDQIADPEDTMEK
ncbi:hypothetical protein KI387_018817, partial [Taxus chinensis]